MRLLLLGDHPDGIDAVLALTRQEPWRLAGYAGPMNAVARLRQAGMAVSTHGDAETALALKDLDWVILADELPHRPELLKRALQNGCSVAVVHPPDLEPDVAYEALLLQQDARVQLVPLLVERLSPGIQALRKLLDEGRLGALRQLEMEIRFNAPSSGGGLMRGLPREWEGHPLLTLWDPLRLVLGEVEEISAVAGQGEILPNATLALTGTCRGGVLFQANLLPQTGGHTGCRLTLRGERAEAVLDAPEGWGGPCRLLLGEEVRELPPAPARGEMLAEVVRSAQAGQPRLTWTDGTRCLELFDAVRRSVRRKRLVQMDYDAVSETGNFKSTMTALGCMILLVVIVLFFATPTFSFLQYFIPPLLILFLLLQLLRWVARDPPGEGSAREHGNG